MKVLFVANNSDFFKPLGVMQLSAIARTQGHEPSLAIISKGNLTQRVAEEKPDVVAYSSTTGDFKTYIQANDLIKAKYPQAFTIMGGPHPTFFPNCLDRTSLDAICLGEGDIAFKELLDKLNCSERDFKINNIATQKNREVQLNPLIEDLDSLPFPDRELFYADKKTKVVNFMTSRGCPFSCSYCFNHAFKKKYPGQKYLRRHSVNYAIEEIKEARSKIDFKFIRFVDDVFAFKEDAWFEEFLEKYPKEVGLPFYAHSRFDLMTPSMAKNLKAAGCTTIQMAIESSNPEIRKGILKRNMTDEQIIAGARYCYENGLSVVTCLMAGIPGTKIEDEIKAVDLCIKSKIPVPEFFVYQPYGGTELGDKCINEGLLEKETAGFSSYGFAHRSHLNCFTESEKDVQTNIAFLGPLVTRHPSIRNLVMNHLIYLKPNGLFKKVYEFEKLLTYPKRVYITEYSLKERVSIFMQALKLEETKRKN